jgi:agmatinase
MSSKAPIEVGGSPALQGSTFLRARPAITTELRPGDFAVVGVPHDVTKISRPGARFGPSAIRQATMMFDYATEHMAKGELIDIDRQASFRYQKDHLKDLGDLDLTSDAATNFDRIRDAIAEVVGAGATPVVLGGDHFITYPCVTGVRKRRPGPIAYFHIDMHLDLADDVPGFGRLASGTPVRRLVDDGTLTPDRIVIVGVESLHHRNEWSYAQSQGIEVISSTALRSATGSSTFQSAINRVMTNSDAAYVSIDIDALSRTFAPGTGNAVGSTGLRPEELTDLVRTLRQLPLAGVDLVEVAPNWDTTGRTAGLAAALLIEVLWPMLFKDIPT